MNKRMYTLGTLGLAIVLCTTLFLTSERVQRVEKDYSALQDKIATEKDRLRVLRAEWTYLNRPDRLEKLAATYLNAPPPRATRLVSATTDANIPKVTLEVATVKTPLPPAAPMKQKTATKKTEPAPKKPKIVATTGSSDTFYQMRAAAPKKVMP